MGKDAKNGGATSWMRPEDQKPAAYPKRPSTRFRSWRDERPGLVPILTAVLLGLSLVLCVAHVATNACEKTKRKQKPPHSDQWEVARPLWGFIAVSHDLCTAKDTPPWLQLSGLAASPAVLLIWYWRDKKRRADQEIALRERDAASQQHLLNQQIAFSERYTKAAELLASADEMTRINGLESLWDIAVQSSNHRRAISRTLAAFVRYRTKKPSLQVMPNDGASQPASDLVLTCSEAEAAKSDAEYASPPEPPADAQTAMTLLSRAEWNAADWRRSRAELDVRGANLARFDLRNAMLNDANLEHTNLADANLADARLFDANLSHANVTDADLTKAFLCGADLVHATALGTVFSGANLGSAKLNGANLTNADFTEEANLTDAKLNGADLTDADLTEAKLNGADLTGAKLDRALLRSARYDHLTIGPTKDFDFNIRGMIKSDPEDGAPAVKALSRSAR